MDNKNYASLNKAVAKNILLYVIKQSEYLKINKQPRERPWEHFDQGLDNQTPHGAYYQCKTMHQDD